MKTNATIELATGVRLERNLRLSPHVTNFRGAACFEIKKVTCDYWRNPQTITVEIELDADIEAVFGAEWKDPRSADDDKIPSIVVQVKPPPSSPETNVTAPATS